MVFSAALRWILIMWHFLVCSAADRRCCIVGDGLHQGSVGVVSVYTGLLHRTCMFRVIVWFVLGCRVLGYFILLNFKVMLISFFPILESARSHRIISDAWGPYQLLCKYNGLNNAHILYSTGILYSALCIFHSRQNMRGHISQVSRMKM